MAEAEKPSALPGGVAFRRVAVAGIAAGAFAAIGWVLLFGLPGPGSSEITIEPSRPSCLLWGSLTVHMHLPSSINEGDLVTLKWDRVEYPAWQMKAAGGLDAVFLDTMRWSRLSDGSWEGSIEISQEDMLTLCAQSADVDDYLMSPGEHEIQLLDADGKVLASGRYTVTDRFGR
jgi:hypothetical protein